MSELNITQPLQLRRVVGSWNLGALVQYEHITTAAETSAITLLS